ncbi:MAG TPA: glycosyltransferase family 4 protein [Thermodesulfovibrionales bacterium]|nr:glycosyltransferase family 4 protein [Thermodesulfovibrionales bacterium]
MKVLLLNIGLGRGWGGIESHSDTLGGALFKRGYNVIMGCAHEGSIEVAGGITLPARKIWIVNSGDLKAIVRIAAIVFKERVDVIIANMGKEYWPAAVAALLLGRKILFIRHQTDRIRRTTLWLIKHHVERVVAVSGAVREALLKSGVSPGKIEIIHNSVPLEKFNPEEVGRSEARQELGVREGEIVVGTVAKLHRGKGVYEILRAFGLLAGKYPRLKLIFVGNGPERHELEEEAGRLSVRDRVIFTGVRKDIERMYAAMDVFALPSTCEEAFGMALIEAMAMGKPVIGTVVGGIPEIIIDGKTGLLVPPGDADALAKSLDRYLGDLAFAEIVARAGQRAVLEGFSERVTGDAFDRIIREIAGKKGRDLHGHKIAKP